MDRMKELREVAPRGYSIVVIQTLFLKNYAEKR